jgi:deoxycytidylate deaminase
LKSRHLKFLNFLFVKAKIIKPASNARVCAGIVYKNDIVTFGINSKKSHPLQAKFSADPNCIYLHAEIDCLARAAKELNPDELAKSTLYISRARYTAPNKDMMTQGLACPCETCQKAIAKFNVGKTIYSLDSMGYAML